MEKDAVLGVEKSLTSQFWTAREAEQDTVAQIVRTAGVSETAARLLAARGVKPENASFFLQPSFRAHLPDPYTVLRDEEKAAQRIAEAVLNGEKIGVFGDYDVDGATSGALMALFLRKVGADVVSRVPEREEGYGPNEAAMREFIGAGVKLVITVDCGTTAFEQLDLLTREKVDAVVLDHHEPDVRLPDVCAVVNPKRLDEPADNPCAQMAAVGVVFMTVIAVNRLLREKGFYATREEPRLMDFLDLVALGTVCDVMALRGLNRLFVKTGLSVLAGKKNKGLKALCDLLKIEKPTAYHLGFVIGPRLNACGRIGKAALGTELLCAKDEEEARKIASRLDELNTERRQMCEEIYKQAIGQIERAGTDEPLIFVYGDGWHPGVVGIIAGRLKERYNAPALVMAKNGDDLRGSGRSVEGKDLGAAVLAAKEKGILTAGGGHAKAAGFSLKLDRAEEFKAFLIDYFQTHRREKQPVEEYLIDSIIDIGAVGDRLLETLSLMEPFGEGNPEPRFALPDVAVSSARIVKSGHVACSFVGRNGRSRVRAIAFNAADSILGTTLLNHKGALFHAAGYIRYDAYSGGAQFIIEDLAPAV